MWNCTLSTGSAGGNRPAAEIYRRVVEIALLDDMRAELDRQRRALEGDGG